MEKQKRDAIVRLPETYWFNCLELSYLQGASSSFWIMIKKNKSYLFSQALSKLGGRDFSKPYMTMFELRLQTNIAYVDKLI